MDRTLWPSVVVLAAVFAICEATGMDLWLQDHFYNFATHRWVVDANATVPRLLFYTGPKVMIWLLGLFTIGAVVCCRKPRKLPFARRDLIILAATLASAPALVAFGKATTDTFTPAQIRRYNGDAPYVKVMGHYPPGDHPAKRGRGFPAGHASGGYSLLALAGMASTRRGRAIGISIGLCVGTMMGTYQMLKGAHYLSHTLVTAILCWIVFLSWRRIIPPAPPAQMPSVPEKPHPIFHGWRFKSNG
ncbi:phosphatase PAP2 family protein [Akkermansiaceae bacterium]|nr:phosphatase PAP2 family protein [Akkermansiaceae bacterium]